MKLSLHFEMNLAKVNVEWVPLQIKVFTRWVNSELKGHDIHVEDITKDLSNGVALVELAKELTHKSLTREWCSSPKRNIDMVQNCDLAIESFEKDGVRLVGISGKDINDNNTKLILGLIWTLILHYSIDQSIYEPTNNNSKLETAVKSQKDALMSWAVERTSNYPNIKNFSPYDLSLCALLDSYYPEKINYYSLNPNDTEHNSKLATDVMNEIGIPVYVYPEEIQESQIDEKALLTQLSKAKVILDKKSVKDEQVPKIQEKSVNLNNSSDEQSEIERLRKELAESNAQLQKERELRENAESKLKEATNKLQELENSGSNNGDSNVNELIEAKENLENENFKLERKLAEVTQKLHQAEKQIKDDNSLIEKMSIELTEQEYDKMEENEEIHDIEENEGNSILEKIANIPKAIVKAVKDNIESIENSNTDNNNNTDINDNNNNSGSVHDSNDTYALSLMDCENTKFIV